MENVFLFTALTLVLMAAATTAQCPTGWSHWQGSCYSFMSQFRLNWEAAEAKCQEAAPNGHLVSIGDAEENKWVYSWWVSMLYPLGGSRFKYTWIGYTDQAEEGVWVWSDGATTSYTNWGGRQPNNAQGISHCATMVTKYNNDPGKWDDGKCRATRAYICEYRI